MTIYIGIDPGIHGGITAIWKDGMVQETWPMPIVPAKKKKILQGLAEKTVTKAKYDEDGIEGLVLSMCADYDLIVWVLEKQQPMPATVARGSIPEFTLGYGYGTLKAYIKSSLRKKDDFVEHRPQDWQATMLTDAKGDDLKKKSIWAATKLWPEFPFFVGPRSRVPSHGLTDAALIAEFERRIRLSAARRK